MTIYVVADIETVENEQAQNYFLKVKQYFPKANLKDPEKIKQDILVKRQKDFEKSALHWTTGRIICLCANVLGAEAKPKTFFGDNEKVLISQFFDFLVSFEKSHPQEQIVFIGKSSNTFDKPFIIGRALRHDIGLPHCMRPYRPITDVDEIFGFGSMAMQRGKLDEYAMGLCIPAKTGHGSQVAEMYNQVCMGAADAWKNIYNYCAVDTDITTELLRRFLKEYEPIDAAPEPNKPEPFNENDIPFG